MRKPDAFTRSQLDALRRLGVVTRGQRGTYRVNGESYRFRRGKLVQIQTPPDFKRAYFYAGKHGRLDMERQKRIAADGGYRTGVRCRCCYGPQTKSRRRLAEVIAREMKAEAAAYLSDILSDKVGR